MTFDDFTAALEAAGWRDIHDAQWDGVKCLFKELEAERTRIDGMNWPQFDYAAEYPKLNRKYHEQKSKYEFLLIENIRLKGLARAIISNNPDDYVADGVTCFDVWRKDATWILGQ